MRRDIQGIRALAVSLVVLDHVGAPGFSGGYLGVDVFFVVSGYLITGLLLREHEKQGRISIPGFYARRARRILPASTLVLVVTTLYAAWSLSASRVHDLVVDVRWSALFMANWHFGRLGTDYFSQDRAPSPVQHYWSLAVEEQFYLAWPALLVVCLLVTRRRWLVVAVLVVVWLGSLGWAVTLLHTSPTAAYFSSLCRAWELATGALLAVGARVAERSGPRLRTILGIVGLVAVLGSAATFDPDTPVPGLPTLVPVLGAAALVVAGFGTTTSIVSRGLAAPPLQWAGDASYSIYLWHWPVLLLGAERLRLPQPIEPLVLVGLTLLLAAASLKYVENPFRHGRLLSAHRGWALALWPVTLVLVAVSIQMATVHADTALAARQAAARSWFAAHRAAPPSRPVRRRSVHRIPVSRLLAQAVRDAEAGAPVPPGLANLRHLGRDIWQTRYTCYLDFTSSSGAVCPVGDLRSSRTVALFGDSHAGMWLPALDQVGRREHLRVIPFLKLGCGPFDVEQWYDGAPMPSCAAFRTWAMRHLRTLHPDVVVLGYRGMLAVHADPGETIPGLWQRGTTTTLAQLTPLTRRVIVLGDISSTGLDPADCLQAPGAAFADCVTGDEPLVLDANTITRHAAKAAGADFVDLTHLVCWRHRCPLATEHVVIYHDSSHVTMTWSRRVARELGDLLDLAQAPAAPTPHGLATP